MKRYVVLAAMLLVGGCSTNPMQERALLLQPAPPNPPSVVAMFEADYSAAIDRARAHPTPDNIAHLVDAGTTVNAIHCNAWIDRDTLAAQGLVLSDHNLAVASALATAVAGIAKWSSAAVAGLGAAEVAVAGFGQNLRGALGAPAAYQAQAALLDGLASCHDQLLANSDLRVSQAILGIAACARTCSPGAASAVSTQAISQGQIKSSPSGALRIQRRQ